MAASKKYAGLPDLDDEGTELYQTPGLTDDASTIQTENLRTGSSTPSSLAAAEGANHNSDGEHFDHAHVDRDEARRRFEPAVVDARDVNFSYAVGGKQKSYRSSRLRRYHQRRSRRVDGVNEEDGDVNDENRSEEEQEETLAQRLARLKKEAEEIRFEIEQREKEDGEFQDSHEHQQGGIDNNEENDADLIKGVEDLYHILNGLQTSTRPKHETLEQEFIRRLQTGRVKGEPPSQLRDTSTIASSSSTISAITDFSDRLSAIETALGVSNISSTLMPTAIIPTLDTLTSQVSILHSTISPRQTSTAGSQSSSSNLTPQMPHLDILQSRLHTLHQSATSLLNARKAAQTALTDLETVRLRSIRSADHLARFQNLANRRYNRANVSSGSGHTTHLDHDDHDDMDAGLGGNVAGNTPRRYSSSRGGAGGGPNTNSNSSRRDIVTNEARERIEIGDEIITPLFLEEQAEKIKALYNVLPTIQDLQPLLPVVLERLRGLSVVHVGAATARADMDDVEARLSEWETEMAKWRDAVDGVERGIEEVKEVMAENVQVVEGMVRGVEKRIEAL